MLAACAVVCVPVLAEVDVVHMNLGQMVNNADKVFRGKVVDLWEGTVSAGGGELPTVTYRLEVTESFKGVFDEKDGVRTVEIQMVGELKNPGRTHGDYESFSVLPDVPHLRMGREYLLLTTTPSPIGLSTTVGLGQGLFKIYSRNKTDWAVNDVDNMGLFKDMDVDLPAEGPISYVQLSDLITTLTTPTGE